MGEFCSNVRAEEEDYDGKVCKPTVLHLKDGLYQWNVSLIGFQPMEVFANDEKIANV